MNTQKGLESFRISSLIESGREACLEGTGSSPSPPLCFFLCSSSSGVSVPFLRISWQIYFPEVCELILGCGNPGLEQWVLKTTGACDWHLTGHGSLGCLLLQHYLLSAPLPVFVTHWVQQALPLLDADWHVGLILYRSCAGHRNWSEFKDRMAMPWAVSNTLSHKVWHLVFLPFQPACPWWGLTIRICWVVSPVYTWKTTLLEKKKTIFAKHPHLKMDVWIRLDSACLAESLITSLSSGQTPLPQTHAPHPQSCHHLHL